MYYTVDAGKPSPPVPDVRASVPASMAKASASVAAKPVNSQMKHSSTGTVALA